LPEKKAWNRWQSSLSGIGGATLMSLDEEAAKYISEETVKTVEEALKVPPTSWLKKYRES